jgi:hypothetical protein
VDSPDPELHGSLYGSGIYTPGKKINQPKKNLKILLLATVLSLLCTWIRAIRTTNTNPWYNETNKILLKKFYCAEYDPLMPTEDDVTETSDAEAMRILEEEDDADPAANASATAATPVAVSDPPATQTGAAPASAGSGSSIATESSDTMDTMDPSKARMDPDPAPGSAIFKTPEAPPTKVPGKSGHSGSVPPPEQLSLHHGPGYGSGTGSRSGSSSRSSSSSDSEFSSAFSSCERNELPPSITLSKRPGQAP